MLTELRAIEKAEQGSRKIEDREGSRLLLTIHIEEKFVRWSLPFVG